MSTTEEGYRVIDLFAGPGGLGEGFASFDDNSGGPVFRNVVSIERDEFSHKTLHLRHFLRAFPDREFPEEYYAYLQDRVTLDELYAKYPRQKAEADLSALRISLGPQSHNEVRRIIAERIGGCEQWALVGGPPCQAYSLVGRSRMMRHPDFEQDERHFLYREYLKIIIDHRPPVFVMENVKGLLSAEVDGESIVTRIVADLTSPKSAIDTNSNGLHYKLYSLAEEELLGGNVDPRLFLVKAEEFGVPQARHRMFIVGIRSDLDVKPGRLHPHKAPTVRQTISTLPSIRSGLSRGEDTPEKWRHEISQLAEMGLEARLNGSEYAGDIQSRILLSLNSGDFPRERWSRRYPERQQSNHPALAGLFDSRLTTLISHETRAHMASDLRRYMFAATFSDVTGRSPKLSDFPEALLPEHQNVSLGRAGTMFSDRFRVQLPHQASTTITSHISKDGHYFIHYDPIQCRSLTVREAARLQTFPDNYKFQGPRTSQYHQVGNAVPPYLARQIAGIIAEVLNTIAD